MFFFWIGHPQFSPKKGAPVFVMKNSIFPNNTGNIVIYCKFNGKNHLFLTLKKRKYDFSAMGVS